MEILNQEEVVREIMKQYRKKVDGWRAFVGADRNDFRTETIIMPDGTILEIKMDSIYSGKPIIFGAKIEGNPEKIPDNGSRYGIHPMPDELYTKLERESWRTDFFIRTGNLKAAQESRKKARKIIYEISKVLNTPYTLDSLRQERIQGNQEFLEGPFQFSPNHLIFGTSQKSIDERILEAVKTEYNKRGYSQYG